MGDKPSKEREKSHSIVSPQVRSSTLTRKASVDQIEELKFLIILENVKCKNLTQV